MADQQQSESRTPDGYILAVGAGDALIPLALRASLADARAEREGRRKAYPSAAIYALHEVGGPRG